MPGQLVPADANLPKEFATVREMLAALDTLTIAGRRHDMTKVAAFIQEYAARSLREHSHRNRQSFALLLEGLSFEAQRLIPYTETFKQRAEDLLILLTKPASASSADGGVVRAPGFASAAVLAD